MTVYTPLSALSTGLYTVLNVSTLTSVATGGVGDDIAQRTAFPFVLFEVSEDDESAFGSRPGSGRGSMVRVRLRCYIYSQYQGMKECQSILAALKQLLATPPSATGFHVWAVIYQGAVPIGDELVAGIKVKELTADWLLDVEEAA